jgi:hypothetical protein
MEVDRNGKLVINAGTASVTGSVNIDGQLAFQSGAIGGEFTISNVGSADLTGAATKSLVGVALTNKGSMTLSGVVGFNTSSVFTNEGTLTISGSTQLMANDNTQTLFDSTAGSITYTGNQHNLRFMVSANVGNISIGSGSIQCFSQVNFASDINVPQGSLISTEGNANVTFGGSLNGQGSVNAASKVTTFNGINITNLQVDGGNSFFAATGVATNFGVAGGVADFQQAVTAANVNLTGGVLQGASGLTATTSASLASNGVNLATSFTLQGNLTVGAKTLLTFNSQGAFNVDSTGNVDVQSPFTVTGPSGTQGVTNNGNINVAAALSSQNIDLKGTGTYTVSGTITTSTCAFQAGSIVLNGGSVTGSNTALNIGSVSETGDSTGNVAISIGAYTLQCPAKCLNVQCASNADTFKFGTA